MSDDLTNDELTNPELSGALREFAARHETSPALTGAEVRGRAAVRRARRRVTGTLVAATAALALVAFALTLDLTNSTNSASPAGSGTQRQIPAATPSAAQSASATVSPVPRTPVTAGSVDLGKGIMIVGKRVMPLTDGSPNTPKVVGPLTVYDRRPEVKTLTVTTPTGDARYNAEISYVVELRDADNMPVYVGAALRFDKENVGRYATSAGWIDLDESDAKWFYASVKPGTAIEVTGTKSATGPVG
ncbi:L,D-transpeptidase [Streptomyces pseudovenezuelae]|uniref:Lipoprotein-anchoring transpeptidase ErfK/SrfK n=1 Tax=Streptomyces pseudovenezuelae TaxID=67350 RepID=A0ABT6LEU9_9ACTN|nr:L,D-transpeptidase [Streptomyces pseudovenezuelae]MDH6214837.1 lipoprotein-anchoring transpeptidase ErfK/SrfK [Streptomyces pseudovenezuelae]